MRKAWMGLLILPFLISGCLVLNLHPLFTEGDTFFDPDLIGTWVDGYGQGYTLEKEGNDPVYRVTAFNPREARSSPAVNARLVMLGKDAFLDVFSPSGTRCEEMSVAVPAHLILKIDRRGDSLTLKDIHRTWLEEQIKAKRVRIGYELLSGQKTDTSSPLFLLTASTESLRRTVEKISSNRSAFSLYKLLVRKGTAYPTSIPVPTAAAKSTAVPAALTATAQ
jgi:hypothetical protein